MELNTLISIITNFRNRISENETIKSVIDDFMRNRPAYTVNQPAHVPAFHEKIDQIRNELIFLNVLSLEELSVLQIYNLDAFASDAFYDQAKVNMVSNKGSSVGIMATFVQKVQNLSQTVQQINNTLEPLKQYEPTIENGKSILEICFEGNTDITNLSNGKEQINSWWLIIDGYAQMLGLRREDFEIVSISKNSPAKIKIEAITTAIVAILGVTAEIIKLESAFITSKIQIEQLKTNSLVKGDLHDQYVKSSETELDARIDKHLSEISAKSIKKNNAPKEISASVEKSVHNQYTFIVNGGNVNFYISDGSGIENLKEVEEAKRQTKAIRNSLKQISLLGNTSDSFQNDQIVTEDNNSN